MTRRGVATVTALACLALAPPASGAGTIINPPGSGFMSYTSDTVSDMVLTDGPRAGGGTTFTIAETGIGVGAPAGGCTDNGDSVTCLLPPGQDVNFNGELGTGEDSADASAVTRSTIVLQDVGGNDELIGGNATLGARGQPIGDVLRGGNGVDRIFGGAGNDEVSLDSSGGELGEGGPGDDLVLNFGLEPTADTMRGGPGNDTLWAGSPAFQAINFTIDLAAGRITEPGVQTDVAEGFENAQTPRGGNDTLLGTNGPNEFLAGPGNDRLVGRLGSDTLQGQDGADTLEARDGVADRPAGGSGTDTCLIDQLDTPSGCESAPLATVAPFGAIFQDVDPPGCKVAPPGRRGLRAGRVASRGLALVVDCDEPGRASARLVGSIKRLGGKGKKAKALLSRAGDIELASRSARLGKGDKATLRLKVGRRYRKLLRRGVRLRAVVKAVDSAGNRMSPRTRRVKLRR